MVENKNSLEAFILNFIRQINSEKSIKHKLMDSLISISEYFQFKRAFIYQTDGFRFFYLKESYGNKSKALRNRFEVTEMTRLHANRMKGDVPFYACENENTTQEEKDVLAFYKAKSLLVRSFKDTEGKTIGFIGFADCANDEYLTEEQIEAINLVTGPLSKEASIREYKEREIRASKTLESIMNNMGVDIYVNSFDSHDMLYANESMAAPYGGKKHFKDKKCWQALYTDKTGECDFCPKKHLIDENGQPTKVYSWDYQRPFDKAWFRVFSAAFSWIDGQIAHVITSVDITNQKYIEEELKIAKDKAENLDRLKSAFLANMSHEIRTPLNSIVGFASLIAETNDMDERQEYVNIMQENTSLLLQLISDILDLSKIEAGTLDFDMGYISTRELCDEIMRSYQIKDNKVPVIFNNELPDYIIYSDKKRLMQVIINFMNNALKFTSAGEVVLAYHLNNDGNLEFYVKDSGIGIAPDKVDKVFDRFVKLNNFAQGTGLGLSICRSIIEQLKGTIGAESEVGVGSRFWFTHPYDPAVTRKDKQ